MTDEPQGLWKKIPKTSRTRSGNPPPASNLSSMSAQSNRFAALHSPSRNSVSHQDSPGGVDHTTNQVSLDREEVSSIHHRSSDSTPDSVAINRGNSRATAVHTAVPLNNSVTNNTTLVDHGGSPVSTDTWAGRVEFSSHGLGILSALREAKLVLPPPPPRDTIVFEDCSTGKALTVTDFLWTMQEGVPETAQDVAEILIRLIIDCWRSHDILT